MRVWSWPWWHIHNGWSRFIRLFCKLIQWASILEIRVIAAVGCWHCFCWKYQESRVVMIFFLLTCFICCFINIIVSFHQSDSYMLLWLFHFIFYLLSQLSFYLCFIYVSNVISLIYTFEHILYDDAFATLLYTMAFVHFLGFFQFTLYSSLGCNMSFWQVFSV